MNKARWSRIVGMILLGGLHSLCATFAATPAGPPAPKVTPAASGPEMMNFQGDLRDGAGKALNGTYAMTFRLFDAATGGTLLLTDAHLGPAASVTVSEGLFDAVLGGGQVTPGSQPSLGAVFADLSAVWLEIQVGGETLSPRMQITSAAYAQNARTLEGKGSTEFAAAAHQHLGADVTSPVAEAALAANATDAANAGNSDKLDGQHAAAFAGAVHGHAGSDISGSVSTAAYAASAGDADTVDGQHANAFAGTVHGHAGTDISGPVAQATTATNAGNSDTLDGEHASSFADSVHAHDASAVSTGILPSARGGTGLSSPGASGNLLTSNGSAWTSSAAPTAAASGAVVDAADTTLTRSGSGTAVSPYELSLNLASFNHWTAPQTFHASVYVDDDDPLLTMESSGSEWGSIINLSNNSPVQTHLGSISFRKTGQPASGEITCKGTGDMTFRAGGQQRMVIDSAGNVGIGTQTPGFPLTFATTFGQKVSLFTTAADPQKCIGFGVQGLLLQIHSDVPESDVAFGYGSSANFTETMRVKGNGRVGIGTTAPSCKLDVVGDANFGSSATSNKLYVKDNEAIWFNGDYFSWGYGGTANRFYDPVGIGGIDPAYQLQLYANSAAKPVSNTWTVPSDLRLKKDIAPFTDGLEVIEKIRPITYRYNGLAGMPKDAAGIGVIAQEIREAAPYTVGTFRAKLDERDEAETELYDFNSHALTFVMINAIKELRAEVQALSGKALPGGTDARRSAIGTLAASGTAARPDHAQTDPGAPGAPLTTAPAPERFPVCEAVEAGDVLVADPAHPGVFCLGRQAADSGVVGIATAGAAISSDTEGAEPAYPLVPVATSGIVRCKVDAAYGPIAVRDLLVASPTPGHAMRAASHDPGTVLGKALEPLEAGAGLIRVLVMPRWFFAPSKLGRMRLQKIRLFSIFRVSRLPPESMSGKAKDFSELKRKGSCRPMHLLSGKRGGGGWTDRSEMNFSQRCGICKGAGS